MALIDFIASNLNESSSDAEAVTLVLNETQVTVPWATAQSKTLGTLFDENISRSQGNRRIFLAGTQVDANSGPVAGSTYRAYVTFESKNSR